MAADGPARSRSTWTGSPTSPTSTDDLPGPGLGPGQQVHGAEGLGLDGLDLRQHGAHRRRSTTWEDFIDAAMGPASGQTSRARHARRAHRASTSGRTASTGTPPTRPTSTPARTFIVDEFAPHIKAFDSYPGIDLTAGNYVLSQVWNGDARQGLLVGGRPRRSTPGASAPRRPSSGWTPGRSSQERRTSTRPTTSSTSSSTRQNSVDRPRVPRLQHRRSRASRSCCRPTCSIRR